MICSCLPYCYTQHRSNLVTQLFPPGFTPPVFWIRLAPDTHSFAVFLAVPVFLICWFGLPAFLAHTFAGFFAGFFPAKLLMKPVPRIRGEEFFARRTFAARVIVFHRNTTQCHHVGVTKELNASVRHKKSGTEMRID
jgi:hypothetical protein